MSKERLELFKNQPLELQDRLPFRPLEGLSKFVVNDLPNILNDIREGRTDVSVLAEKADRQVTQQLFIINKILAFSARANKDQQKAVLVARLDLLMLKAAILNEGGAMGPALTDMVERIATATNRPAGLMYEDVVINNPIEDIRTFTNGAVGESEASFYNGHRYIELDLEPSVKNLKYVLRSPQIETSKIEDILRSVIDDMRSAIAFTGIIRKQMPVEHFAGVFRKYFSSDAARDIKGPSGAFSPRIPLIEYLLMGETVPQVDVDYQIETLQYFPLSHQPALIEALSKAQAGHSIKQILERRIDGTNGLALIQELSEMYKRFRTVHMKAVETHLPEVFQGKEQGTGGTEVDFLQRRLDRNHGFNENGNGTDH